jgi:GT2 family glycosyltransferase
MLIDNNDHVSRTPLVSVIVASYNSGKTIEKCLNSLRNQRTDRDFEAIVVDSSIDGSARLVEEKFPEARLYKFSDRKFVGDARNIGIAAAKGKIIVFTDADCTAEGGWIDEIVKAHEHYGPAIGGSIANGSTHSYVGSAAYFCEFSQWMPAKHAKRMADIPGANMSYKKEVFERYGRFIEGTYCSDTEFHWRLNEDGLYLQFVPSVLVFHHSIDDLKDFLRHEFVHGRSFAQVRIRSRRFSSLKRLFYVVILPLIFLKIFFKIVLNHIKNAFYIFDFLRTMPLVILGVIFWSVGESAGYLESLYSGSGSK